MNMKRWYQMYKVLKSNYLFFIVFILFLVKEPIINLFNYKITNDTYVECNNLKSDYNKLLEFNNISYKYNTDYVNTTILFKDIYGYMNEISIRGGSDLHFNINDPVIYDNTLVGIISKVNKNNSVVKMISNKDIKISVKVNDAVGVLKYSNNEFSIYNIENYNDISIGDEVYTSGLGNIGENIFIGVVKDIKNVNKDIEKQIIIDYKINFKKIKFVTVMRENV